jgi:flagellar hook-length control protein FliK
MNSVGIEPFLNATQAADKPKASAPSNGSGGEFNDYLREATNTQQQPAKEQPTTKAQPADQPVRSTSQEHDSANSSDEQTAETVEAADQVEAPVEEQPIETDEVLLSVAAIAAAPVEVALVAEVPEIDVAAVAESAPVEPTQPQPGNQTAATQDFLPALKATSADSASTPVERETAAPIEPTASIEANVPVDAAASDDAPAQLIPIAESHEPAPVSNAQQAGAEKQIKEQATETGEPKVDHALTAEVVDAPVAPITPQSTRTNAGPTPKTDDNAEKPDTTEAKSSKLAVADKQAAAEQIVAEVAATVLVADSSHEVANKSVSDASSAPISIPATSAPQQSQGSEAARADAQALPGDSESRMPTIDRSRFVQRVANAFRSAQQNDGQIQMRLSPPELGSLRIEIAVRNGVLSANLETETADARRVLLDNLPALRQRLAELDIRIEKFDVDIRREGGQSDGQAGAQDRQAQQQSLRAAERNRIRTTATPEVIAARVPRSQTVAPNAGLDVRI